MNTYKQQGANFLDLSQLGFKLDGAYSNQYPGAEKQPATRPNIAAQRAVAAPSPATYQPYARSYSTHDANNNQYTLPPKLEAGKVYEQAGNVYEAPDKYYEPPSPVIQPVPVPQHASPVPAPVQVPQQPQRFQDTAYATTAPVAAYPPLFPGHSDPTLRKLGQNEKIFHGTPTNGGSYIFRAALVTSQIDLYKNINVVREAIDQWKLLHPLLRARVLPRGPDKFFTFATDEKIRSLENVKFLVYRSNAPTVCDEVWKFVVEKETTQGMDGENGLLWRLTFLQLRNKSTGEFQYAIIIAFDHSIMDGRSSFGSLLELMSIIEGVYTKTYARRTRHTEIKEILPPKEELFAARHKFPGLNNQLSFIKAPSFIDMQNAINTTYIRPKSLGTEEEQRGMIYHYDGRQYAPLSALIQVSKLNNSKFRTLTIAKADMGKLLAKCKENNVKHYELNA